MGIEPTYSAWKAEVLPLNYTRKTVTGITYHTAAIHQLWWRGEDSNLRRRSQQIYSLPPLATREPLQKQARYCDLGQNPCQQWNQINLPVYSFF